MKKYALILISLFAFSLVASAHKYPFDGVESKVRKIHSEHQYKWKVDNFTKLEGTYVRNNIVNNFLTRERGVQESKLKTNCAAKFTLMASEAPDSRVRKIGKHYPVDGQGFLLVELESLKCTHEDSNGSAAFSTSQGAPHSTKINTSTNTQAAHNTLKKQIDKFTDWWKQRYVIRIESNGDSQVYQYQGAWREGDIQLDTGLFNGAFINFAKPSLDAKGVGNVPLSSLFAPQPMFMRADETFGPNRVPQPVDTARVTMQRLAGGVRAYQAKQRYEWEDRSAGSSGHEAITARYELVPAQDFGYVHRSQWKADLQYVKLAGNSEQRFERSMRTEFHFKKLPNS